MIKNIFEQSIQAIEANRKRQIEQVSQRVLSEQVVPFNAEIDEALRKALAELQTVYAEQVSALQKSLDDRKQELSEKANRKKAEFAKAAIESATAAINTEADRAIKHLRDYIGKE